MRKTSWIFPGQGSQYVGMGSDLLALPEARVKFQQAEAVLGWSVLDICQSSDEILSRTLYTQPCLYVISSILVDLLSALGRHPALVAGHSLGEYVALYAAKVFDFESGLRLVKHRAELMDNASGGIMAALVGFDRDQLTAQIQQTPNVVLANDNHDGQVVISGVSESVEAVLASIKTKRVVRLNVSGAFHSPLMADAAAEFQALLDSVPFQNAQVPVLSNVEPTPTVDALTLKERLSRQMTGSVRWTEISRQFLVEGIEHVIEIGPGKVLTGLVKRTCPDLILENIQYLSELLSSTNTLVPAMG
jgi:[acyl-carrier-protein] S-malonyltransferase